MGVFPPFKETPTRELGHRSFPGGFFHLPICEKLRLTLLEPQKKGESHWSGETVFWKTHNTRVGGFVASKCESIMLIQNKVT